MVAYLYRMPSGIQGDITRRQSSTVDASILNSSLPFPSFGVPGKLVSGKFVPLVANDLASSIAGFLVRSYPTTGLNASDPLGTAVPPSRGVADRLLRGYMSVVCNAGTPTVNGQVYVRVANPSGAAVIGGIEAASVYATTTGTAGANTGNGTIGTLLAVDPAKTGTYKVTMTAATAFTVDDPDGLKLKNGATGTAYTDQGLTFTVTVGGTPFVAGDSFTVAVVANTVPISNCRFQSAGDAAKNVEISYKM